jgi:hypothetical protein
VATDRASGGCLGLICSFRDNLKGSGDDLNDGGPRRRIGEPRHGGVCGVEHDFLVS